MKIDLDDRAGDAREGAVRGAHRERHAVAGGRVGSPVDHFTERVAGYDLDVLSEKPPGGFLVKAALVPLYSYFLYHPLNEKSRLLGRDLLFFVF